MRTATQPLTDDELVRRARAGSLTSFEELVYRHEARLHRFFSARCSNPADVQDLMQTTFVKAYRALGRFRSGYPFGAWLFAIARSKLLDHFRTQQPASPPLAQEPWDPHDPAALLAERDGKQAIWRLAQRLLPANQFDALWLMYKEELCVKDIAVAMNKTQTHVKVLLFRARQALVRSLRPAAGRPVLGPRGAPLCPAAAVREKPVG